MRGDHQPAERPGLPRQATPLARRERIGTVDEQQRRRARRPQQALQPIAPRAPLRLGPDQPDLGEEYALEVLPQEEIA